MPKTVDIGSKRLISLRPTTWVRWLTDDPTVEVIDLLSAVTLLRADESLAELEPLLAFFASFVLKTETVQRIMRWDMAVLRESPWYEQILAEGLEQGRQQGFQEGRQEGQEEILVRILSRRFGDLPLEFVERLRQLKTEQLLQMADMALEAPSLAEVEVFLTKLLANSKASS